MSENKFGTYVRLWRKKKGLTQKELAGIIGMSNSMLSNYESGDSCPTIEVIKEIAKGLNLTPEEQKAMILESFGLEKDGVGATPNGTLWINSQEIKGYCDRMIKKAKQVKDYFKEYHKGDAIANAKLDTEIEALTHVKWWIEYKEANDNVD